MEHSISRSKCWTTLALTAAYFGHQQELPSGVVIRGRIQTTILSLTIGRAALPPVEGLQCTGCCCFSSLIVICKSDSTFIASLNTHTCADVVVDAIHRDGGIGYSSTLGVPHDPFDPAMHLRAISTGKKIGSIILMPSLFFFLSLQKWIWLLRLFSQRRLLLWLINLSQFFSAKNNRDKLAVD